MPKPERRRHRSEKPQQALNLFLESVRSQEGVEALAVTTHDGFLVAGVGAPDLEWMGAMGAASARPSLTWEQRTLHVQRLEVDQETLCLTSTGRPANALAVREGLARILAT